MYDKSSILLADKILKISHTALNASSSLIVYMSLKVFLFGKIISMFQW